MNGFVVVNPPPELVPQVLAYRLGFMVISIGQRDMILQRVQELREELRAEAVARGVHRHEIAKQRVLDLREAAPAWHLQWATAADDIEARRLEYAKEAEIIIEMVAEEPNDEDLAYPPQEVIEGWLRACKCCPECSDPPCGSVQQGGVCEVRCRCDEDVDDGYDPNGCPGCGGNCQTACR